MVALAADPDAQRPEGWTATPRRSRVRSTPWTSPLWASTAGRPRR
jgi:hypothetical protein